MSHTVPKITISENLIEVEGGESFSITCTSSLPNVDFTWDFPGRFFELENVEISGNDISTSISVSGATLQNEGNYTCELRDFGELTFASATATVDVIHRELHT